MQYYTKQQLQGAGAYGPRCRIGNWDEDLMAEETQFKDFLRAKERGELKVRIVHALSQRTEVHGERGHTYFSLDVVISRPFKPKYMHGT